MKGNVEAYKYRGYRMIEGNRGREIMREERVGGKKDGEGWW